jgi:hypothetical protein
VEKISSLEASTPSEVPQPEWREWWVTIDVQGAGVRHLENVLAVDPRVAGALARDLARVKWPLHPLKVIDVVQVGL